MCPMCLSTLGWIALAGLILAVRRRNQKDEDDD